MLSDKLGTIVDCIGSLERIRSCQIPIAFSIHLRQSLILYLASLPFQLVPLLGTPILSTEWKMIFVMFITSFTLLGILAISGEIENPFGYDKGGNIDVTQRS